MSPAGLSHRRAAAGERQRIWFAFAEVRHHWWQRLLRPGHRHCFAALEDERGWTVVEALTGRLLVTRLDVPAGFDLPGFYRRAGLFVSGPHEAESPRPSLFPPTLNCVSVGRLLLGRASAPCITPYGFRRALARLGQSRKKNLINGPLGR